MFEFVAWTKIGRQHCLQQERWYGFSNRHAKVVVNYTDISPRIVGALWKSFINVIFVRPRAARFKRIVISLPYKTVQNTLLSGLDWFDVYNIFNCSKA